VTVRPDEGEHWQEESEVTREARAGMGGGKILDQPLREVDHDARLDLNGPFLQIVRILPCSCHFR